MENEIKMDTEKLTEFIKEARENPYKYIKYLEENHGLKLYWYQKVYLKMFLKDRRSYNERMLKYF